MLGKRKRLGRALISAACLAFAPQVGATEKAPEVSLVAVPGSGRPIAARCDAQGTIHLLCADEEGPQYLRSVDDGVTFSPPLAVVVGGPRPAGLVYEGCDLAVGQDGRVHVALSTNAWKLKLPTAEWGFFYARLEPGAEAFEPVRNINHKPSEGYSLAADGRGNVTACWLAGKLYANVSHDGGHTFGPTVELDASFNPCDCCTTSATYASDGRLAVLYREETNNDRDMFLVLWDQAKNRVSRMPVSTTTWKIDGCPMTYYTVMPQRDGFVAVWPTEGQVYLARLDAKAALLPPGEIRTPGRSGMRSGMLSLTDAAGNTLVAWKRNERLGWQIYDDQGRPRGAAESATSAGTGAAGVLTKDGRFMLFP